MKIIGHRGARGLAPENTIASIEKAIQHGVDEIEVDVRMTKDHVAVLHHDSHVTDPSGAEVAIKHTKYVDLLRHKPDLAPLDHAIRTIAHRCPVIIEIKPGEKPAKTIEIIRYYLAKGWRLDEFSIASYDQRALATCKQELPGIQLVVNEVWSGIRATHRARKLSTKRINMYELWLYTAYIRMARRNGYELAAFPTNKRRWLWLSRVNKPRRLKRWQPYLYGAITDRPDRFEKK
jgi:glycerophosphoryl diester phosphodiesterase